MNNSPWLAQLDQSRITNELTEDRQTDIAIVGGGIAGMVTAYFVLKMTQKKVILVEANKIAHGATGHNAGQIVSYFEKPYFEIVKEYGKAMALKAMDAINQAWDLLDEIVRDVKLQQPIYKFTDFTGYADLEEILQLFRENDLNREEGLPIEKLWIADNAPFLSQIPSKYKRYYTLASQQFIQEKLDTKNNRFWAVGGILGGCMNSALFVEELAGYLLKTYPDRFHLYENSPMSKVILSKTSAHLMVRNNLIIAKRVVLCTNGFENFSIVNLEGRNIDLKYHDTVRGVVGYMAGYRENSDRQPGAFTFFEGGKSKLDNPYFYLTRRPFSLKDGEKYNLVCIGGPESELLNNIYDKEHIFPQEAKEKIDHFVRDVLAKDVKEEIDYKFFWHGLMGYTKSGLRLIGPDPCNGVLLYNLGCNGVGLMTSIYGGKRIAQFILRRKLAPSVFDPFNQVCALD